MKFFKRFCVGLAVFIIIVLLLVLTAWVFGVPPRALWYNTPDEQDIHRFPYKTIQAADTCFEFVSLPKEQQYEFKVNDWSTDIPFFVSLDELMKTKPIRSFLIIQRDTILYEAYGQGTDQTDMHSSYSIAKSFTSALIGIAIGQGHILSSQSLVKEFIPELDYHPYFDVMTIEHLLNQTSGIQFTMPQDATIYYGDDILEAIRNIDFENAPGKQQRYLNLNTQLLGLVLKNATGKSAAEYLQDEIWKNIGACNEARWTIDNANSLEKTYCCMGATARDYAKFGRLYLNDGNWNGRQVVSQEWCTRSTARDTSNGSSFNYNYSWHLGLKEYNDFMAIGLYKQHIYVNRDKEIIIVLLNDEEREILEERVNWWFVFWQIVDQLD